MKANTHLRWVQPGHGVFAGTAVRPEGTGELACERPFRQDGTRLTTLPSSFDWRKNGGTTPIKNQVHVAVAGRLVRWLLWKARSNYSVMSRRIFRAVPVSCNRDGYSCSADGGLTITTIGKSPWRAVVPGGARVRLPLQSEQSVLRRSLLASLQNRCLVIRRGYNVLQ